jgi:hypothetical protein
MNAVHASFFEGLAVPEAIETIAMAHSYSFALISVLEGGPALESTYVVGAIEAFGGSHWTTPAGVLVRFSTLETLTRDNSCFAGFDEVWLFDQRPAEPLASPPRFSSDREMDEALTSEIGEWMERSGCATALGDGLGLNVATVDPKVDAVLRR